MSDSRVSAAIAHWAPRYVENGVPVGDFGEVTDGITNWDQWCAAWSDRGAVHAGLGKRALSTGLTKSAAFHFLTASACYHFAKFLFVHDLAQMKEAHDNAVATHRVAHPLLDPPMERVAVPYGSDHRLVGNLWKPAGVPSPPVVLMFPGLDSAKEELTSYARWFVDRSVAALMIDGPGQGEAEYDLPIEPYYEKPATAAIDYLETRTDVDATRVGAWGVSLGGYYVVRAAAYEPRIKAIVSLSGPYRFVDKWDELPELTRLAFQVRSHTDSEAAAREACAALDLAGVAEHVACPAYIVGGELDRLIPPEAATQIAREIEGPVRLDIVAGGNHVVNNKAYMYRPQTADWMAEQL